MHRFPYAIRMCVLSHTSIYAQFVGSLHVVYMVEMNAEVDTKDAPSQPDRMTDKQTRLLAKQLAPFSFRSSVPSFFLSAYLSLYFPDK